MRAFLGVEYEASDTIKGIFVMPRNTEKEEVYVISLIEHKSDIDYMMLQCSLDT